MSLKHAILMAAACLALFSCQEKRKADHETRLLLGELDGYLSAQGMYVARKMDELAFMRRQIAASRDPLASYDLEMSLANAAFSFSFDTTRTHLQRARLLRTLEKDSKDWRTLRRDQLTQEGRYASADSLARVMLSGTRPEEHEYAIYAFHVSEIASLQGRSSEQLYWLIRSAQSDILNAVRDYASLTMVGQIILPYDVDRSFRYLRIAQEDALKYGRKRGRESHFPQRHPAPERELYPSSGHHRQKALILPAQGPGTVGVHGNSHFEGFLREQFLYVLRPFHQA